MGLDSVEIILDTEKCFGIEIEDREAQKMKTVGDLVDYVWDNIQKKDSKACLTQILFFRLRKFFFENLDISSNDFKPNTPISDIIKKQKTKPILQKLESDLKLKLPTIFIGGRILFIFKDQSDTVLDLIDGIIYKNFEELGKEFGITKNTIFSIIASITHNTIGVARKEIISSAKFVDDLGLS